MNQTAPYAMTINRFIHPRCEENIHPTHTPEFFAENPETYKLIVELAVKFKANIYGSVYLNNEFYFCDSRGIELGHAWIERRDEELHYCFYSMIITKSKGRGNDERRTFRSTKLSYLVSALSKVRAFDPAMSLALYYTETKNVFDSADGMIRPAATAPETKTKLTRSEYLQVIESALSYTLGQTPMYESSSLPQDKLRAICEEYRAQDAHNKAVDVLRSKFHKSVAVRVDEKMNQAVLCDMSIYEMTEPVSEDVYTSTIALRDHHKSDLSRYKEWRFSLDNFRRVPASQINYVEPDLVTVLMMLSTEYSASTDKQKYINGAFPIMDHFNEPLEVVHYYTISGGGRGRCIMAFIAK